jgi:hypothetical protein
MASVMLNLFQHLLLAKRGVSIKTLPNQYQPPNTQRYAHNFRRKFIPLPTCREGLGVGQNKNLPFLPLLPTFRCKHP